MKCVYKIVCRDKDITEFYIGSSVDFNERKLAHKSTCNNLNQRQYCLPLYMFINVNGGFENWEIVVIKEYKFITKKELKMNEQHWKDLLKPTLNSYNVYGLDLERNKISVIKRNNFHNNIKANCPHCNKKMLKNNIKRHIKVKH